MLAAAKADNLFEQQQAAIKQLTGKRDHLAKILAMQEETEAAETKVRELQKALSPLDELETTARKELRAAENNRTPAGLNALIKAREKHGAAAQMLKQQQADIAEAQAAISRRAAEAAEADRQHAYADALAELQRSKNDWTAVAASMASVIRAELEKLHTAEIHASEAYEHAHNMAIAAGYSFSNQAHQVQKPAGLTLDFRLTTVAGFDQRSYQPIIAIEGINRQVHLTYAQQHRGDSAPRRRKED